MCPYVAVDVFRPKIESFLADITMVLTLLSMHLEMIFDLFVLTEFSLAYRALIGDLDRVGSGNMRFKVVWGRETFLAMLAKVLFLFFHMFIHVLQKRTVDHLVAHGALYWIIICFHIFFLFIKYQLFILLQNKIIKSIFWLKKWGCGEFWERVFQFEVVEFWAQIKFLIFNFYHCLRIGSKEQRNLFDYIIK